MTLIDAPKSSIASVNIQLPMSSLRNLAYLRAYFMVLRSGILVSTFLNSLRKSSLISYLLAEIVQLRNDSGILLPVPALKSWFSIWSQLRLVLNLAEMCPAVVTLYCFVTGLWRLLPLADLESSMRVYFRNQPIASNSQCQPFVLPTFLSHVWSQSCFVEIAKSSPPLRDYSLVVAFADVVVNEMVVPSMAASEFVDYRIVSMATFHDARLLMLQHIMYQGADPINSLHDMLMLFKNSVYANLFLLCMTRSGFCNLHAYVPEIDRTLYRLRNSRSNKVVNNSSINCNVSASDSVSNTGASDLANSTYSNFDLGSFDTGSDSNFGVSISQFGLDNMENNDRTLKELATSDVMYQPWCIQYLELEQVQSYELKSGLINLLPKFHGLVGKDPHKHLEEFHVVCSTIRLHGIFEDYIKMKAFPRWSCQGLVVPTTSTV
ncbi:hypothetical protein CR513_31691, partial [Mucuna pruriens]